MRIVSTMKLINCIFCVLASCLCQGSVRVVQHAGSCTWTPAAEGNESRPVLLARESKDQLLDRVCADLGCGAVYSVNEADPNTITSTNTNNGSGACLADCSYRDRRLFNCTETVGSNCSVVSEVVCGHQVARLAGGAHRCGGRVELWAGGGGGGWGTVCDDGWDLAAGDVVCRQLGCGYAVNVSGQGGAFPPATAGPVHLDELTCGGAEGSLWACPVAPGGGHHDCGHKEDAGVVCSEMRAVRLSGGADRCSGTVEVHLNGTWGTVCDTCWDRQTAAMVCSMLGCGATPRKYTRFEPPLRHGGGPQWFYTCGEQHTHLWQCTEYLNVRHLCATSKAAGLVCDGSRGFPTTSTANVTPTPGLTTALTTAGTTTGSARDHFLFSPELIGCVVLSVVLLVTLTVNCVVYLRRRRRKTWVTQHRDEHPDTSLYDYREALSGAKVAPARSPVLFKPSGMLASHHGPYEPSRPPPVHLSTFNNSRRHRPGPDSPAAGAAVNRLYQDSSRMGDRDEYGDRHKHQSLSPSADSFESSSTSSGEDYENEDQKEDQVTAAPQPSGGVYLGPHPVPTAPQQSGGVYLGPHPVPTAPQQSGGVYLGPHPVPSAPQQSGGVYVDFDVPPTSPATGRPQRPPRGGGPPAMLEPGPGEDDEEEDLYSPVSPETPPSSSTDDYDDVLNP